MRFTISQQDESAPGAFEAAVKEARLAGSKQLDIVLSAGVYRLPRPLLISSDMGLERVSISGENREKTIICGSVQISSDWQREERGCWSAMIEKQLDIDVLYVNGQLYHMARYPKYSEQARYMQGTAADCLSIDRVSKWQSPEGGYFHVMHGQLWGDFHYRITGKDEAGAVILEGGTQNNRRTGLHESYRYIEHIAEELTDEREWFYNRQTGKLSVIFAKDDHPEDAVIEAVVNDQLFRVTGSESQSMQFSLSHVTCRQTARTFMKTAEPLLRSDWCIYRGGALYFRHTTGCLIKDCDLVDLGSNAVFVDGKNDQFKLSSCLIKDIGASGVCFVGDADSVRSPLFEYNERNHIDQLDLMPGPRNDHFPFNCLVEDCLITRIGRTEKQSSGVQISMSQSIHVSACSIYETPRAGINISEGTFGGHVIEHCDVFDSVLETSDHGSFNSWGRDRFYELQGVDLNHLKGSQLEHLPFLDAVKVNCIRHNRFRCDHGWDIDLDDGSSNYVIEYNLCLNGGIKLREGFSRRVDNNITVNNSVHVHVWYQDSKDKAANNILFDQYQPIRMPEKWGLLFNNNIFHEPNMGQQPRPATCLRQESGGDGESIVCDCQFINTETGDFTVSNQAVLDIGFSNFAMDEFGVRSERLKAKAKTPVFPDIE